ncbi:uncharacterized protein E0L32_001015 [Thyridium curvatum]|uniref:Uncharacterized protein n=1 Tax=Thyridium curvatum TaxID=1093900 RepID=A0A507AUN1_9PEZI|nr:uncharacterized protein E0L32_001015 [Thyridium curvatum]TPX11197.1 hypothetical protein E0L32_001015 [Thyridium curvatum]
MPGTGPDAERAPKGEGTAAPLRTRARNISQASTGLAGSPSSLSSLAKSDSTASAGRFSINSHVSIPVTGSLPLGSLQLHQPADSPSLPPTSGGVADATVAEEEVLRPEPACLENGDCFLILGLPSDFTVGCDMMALNTKQTEFLGFRDLHPGPHFIWVSEPSAMSRCGYWFVTKERGDVRVKQWDSYTEVLGEASSQFEVRNHKDNIESTYRQLVPYRYRPDDSMPPPPPPKDPPRPGSVAGPDLATDDAVIWHHLTSYITEHLLCRVTGKKGAASEWMVETSDMARGEVNFAQASRLFKAVAGSELSFLFPRGDVDLHLLLRPTGEKKLPDTTADVLRLLEATATAPTTTTGLTEGDLVGELQFAFLTGAHLSNLSCMEQWWHLVLKVVFRAYGLALARPVLCRSLVQTLHAQLVYNEKYISGGNDDDDDGDGAGSQRQQHPKLGGATGILEATSPRNMHRLREALKLYKRRLDEALLGLGDAITREQAAVGHAFVDLEAWFWKHGWDLRSSSDEYYVAAAGDEEGGEQRKGWARLGVPHRGGHGPDDSDEDDDEYEPVVVQLDAEGREVGLVNWN